MNVAVVKSLTPVMSGANLDGPCVVVRLEWQGMAYFWQVPAGTYTLGQQIPILPPECIGGPIRPAQSDSVVSNDHRSGD